MCLCKIKYFDSSKVPQIFIFASLHYFTIVEHDDWRLKLLISFCP
jgi:hypothetical protein